MIDRQNTNESAEIDATIVKFKINSDFTIDNSYDNDLEPNINDGNDPSRSDKEPFKWSLDISNIQKYQHDEYFILVAVSCIDDEDMKGTHNNNDKCDKCKKYKKGSLKPFKFNLSSDNARVDVQSEQSESKKGTAICRLKLEKIEGNENYVLENTDVTCHYSDSVSGICRFVEDLDETPETSESNDEQEKQEKQLKRFIILNFHGIHNFKFNGGFKTFELNKRYKYPKSVWHELNIETLTELDLMDKLLTCLYDQYFLVEWYKNNAQVFEGKIL